MAFPIIVVYGAFLFLPLSPVPTLSIFKAVSICWPYNRRLADATCIKHYGAIMRRPYCLTHTDDSRRRRVRISLASIASHLCDSVHNRSFDHTDNKSIITNSRMIGLKCFYDNRRTSARVDWERFPRQLQLCTTTMFRLYFLPFVAVRFVAVCSRLLLGCHM